MAMNPANQYIVTRNETDFRFEVPTADGIAYIDYRWSGEILILLYIFVPVSFRGQGISSDLIEHVLNYAVEKKVKIKVFCPYIGKYIRMHPEHQGLLAHP
jgi:predicted GNAT family acetyltransferase